MAGATEDSEDGEGREASTEPGRPERPRLRRSPLGYRRADVDAALETRDSQLAELRQDIAALWLAFAQHDRMLRALGGEPAQPTPAPRVPEPEPEPGPDQAVIAAEAASIGEQLSELDDVLAAIEMATQTLERTYADEIRGGAGDAAAGSEPEPAEGDEQPGT